MRVERVFPRELADEGRAILWRDTGCDPAEPATWTLPVIRLDQYGQEPFRKAVNAPPLLEAYDALVGKGRWQRRSTLGTFPVRFPSPEDPGDTGWHVDASFSGEGSRPDDYLSWRVNVYSRGRALLMLFLFSDVDERDAPTRIAAGSHLQVARILKPRAEKGMTVLELAAAVKPGAGREVLATGAAGTVYLCHPHLLHAAQPHCGRNPRFMAQPPLLPATPLQLSREDQDYSPVERAIRLAIGLR